MLPTGTVTFLFTDIEGSTSLAQQFPTKLPILLARHNTILRQAIESHNGYIFQFIGDSYAVAFHTAQEALAAALEAQRMLQAQVWKPVPIRVRMGLHTGAAQAIVNDESSGGYEGYFTLARAQRVMSVAHGGQVLLSNPAAELVRIDLPSGVALRDMGDHRLKSLVNPEHLWQVVAAGLQQDFPPLQSLNEIPNNLPVELTSFIGRITEIRQVKQGLAQHRLVTLTGSGGTGKTRLSLQVAADLLDQFDHGVWFVELAPLVDPDLIPQTIISVIGIREQPGQDPLDVLKEYLHGRRVLIVLDNCEHLVEASAKVVNVLLNAAPHLKILATSHEALRVKGEMAYPVPTLSLPDPKHLPVIEQLSQYEAVHLFIDRASLVSPRFELTIENAPAIAQICYRLDGIPLAIELAASRIKMMSVEQISKRLDDRFRLLTGGARTALPRQQTLRALIDWSYDLLSDNERRLLRRLSVFSSGWIMEAAEEVCSGDGIELDEVLDLLTQLVNKSLVIVMVTSQSGETRYRMLETIRQYAREKMYAAGETSAVHIRHRDWYMKIAGQAESELKGAEQSEWLDRLEREHDNFRAALAWSLETDAALALQLAVMLGQFWFMRGHHFGEGIEWLERVLSRVEATGQEAARAKAFRWLGTLSFFHGDLTSARSAYEQSLALSKELQDLDNITDAFFYLADTAKIQGDVAAARNLYAQARSFATDSLASLRKLGDQWKIASTLNILGEIARVEGDYTAARRFYEESLRIRHELGDQRGIAVSLFNLGIVAHHDNNYQQATTLFSESLDLFQKHGGKRGVIDCLMGLAGVAASARRPVQAAQLLGAMEAQREALHIGPMAAAYADRVEYERYVAIVRAQLDEASFNGAWAEGRTMTLEQATTCALMEVETISPVHTAKERFGGLTAREREAAALIAQGKSNREIAEAMTVGVKTAETYVTRILNKLGFDSRMQIAIWAIEKGLVPPAQSPNG